MANSWNDPGEQERRRPERSGPANSGIDRVDSWGDGDSPADSAQENEMRVLDLLQRLESDSDLGAGPVNENPRQQPTKWAQWDPEISCSACHYVNAADQRFCGYCGSPLQAQAAPLPEPLYPQEPRVQQSRPAAPEAPAFIFDTPAAEEAPPVSQITPQAREKNESDLEFLRYKTLGVQEPSRSWKIPVAVAILAIAGFVGYRMYNRLSLLPAQFSASGNQSPAEPNMPAVNADQTPAAESGSSASQTVQETPPFQPRRAEKPSSLARAKSVPPFQGEDHAAVTAATQRSREATSTLPKSADAGFTGGREELAQAERYLSPASRDSAEAAKWLWKSVAKENSRAVLLLSDLYAKGDGVAKSCDQARLLLMVAAKKGNAGAASRLSSLDTTGCQ